MLNIWYNIKMLRYNWEQIRKYCNFDPILIVGFLRTCRGIKNTKAIPFKLKRLAKKGVPKGVSYILNLDDLLQDKSLSVYDIQQYLDLASRRNFFDFKQHGLKSLPKVAAYDSNIQFNRLLTVDNDRIHFLYE